MNLLASESMADQGTYDSPHTFLSDSYNALPPEDKIALIAFLCDSSVSSKSVRAYMETCEEQLTNLRKEKAEVNREKKRW